MSTTTRERGVLLTLLELDDVVASAEAFYHEKHPDKPGTSLRLGFEPYAVADTNHGLFVVCNEGVGYEITDDDPLELDFYTEEKDEDGKVTSFGILPVVASTLSPDDVRKHATGEQVDLADLIRSFGARLESNFHIWHDELTKEA